MKEVMIQFCSSIEEGNELYGRIQDKLDVYYESEQIEDAKFEREPDTEMCYGVRVDIQNRFYETLVDDMTELLDDDHGCDVVVVEDEEGGTIRGNCTVHVGHEHEE